jgi:hypothetical protein
MANVRLIIAATRPIASSVAKRKTCAIMRGMKSLRHGLIGLVLFALALALRLPGLGGFLTPDEGLWAGRTAQYITALQAGDWAATNITGHPGVTTLWAGTLGLAAKWLFARPADMPTFTGAIHALAADPVRLDFLPWLRLPIVLACSLGVALVYLLARRLVSEPAALLGAGLLLFDPFMLAHGRVLQMDALLATNVTLAWLALLIGTQTHRRRYFLLSGLFIGLGVLTKSPALVMGPLMLVWVVGARIAGRQAGGAATARAAIIDLLSVGAPALAVAFALWPSLWVAPITTVERVWGLMTVYGAGGHELGNYWLGHEVSDPAATFYVATLLWRITPLTLGGLLLALLTRTPHDDRERRSVWGFLALTLWFGTIISLGDKKFDRYLLPIFPTVDLLAGWGWVSGARWVARTNPAALKRMGATAAIGAVLVIGGQAGVALANRPTYFTAYNPLMGGIATAQQTFLVGWGEGLAEAAGFLNALPGASDGHVAAWYGQNVFGAFYHGQSYDLYYDTPTAADLYTHDVDYVVTYVNQMQRGLLDPSIESRLAEPLYTGAQGGVALTQVYAWPKPFTHTTDRSLAAGLRLLGWDARPYDTATHRTTLTLYWDTAALAASPRAAEGVTAWIKDDGGEVWAKVTGITSARQTGAWLDRNAAAQVFSLQTPAGLAPGDYRLEVAPAGSSVVGIAQVKVGPTSLASIARTDGKLPDAERVPLAVDVAGRADLVGYSLQRIPGELVVDLLWTAPPVAAGVPTNGTGVNAHVFMHLLDAQGQMAAQADVALPAWPAGAAPQTMARQRLHLRLPPAWEGKSYRLYVGAYYPADGSRLAATVGGTAVPDNRYLLASIMGW